jgi:hypothetical protein
MADDIEIKIGATIDGLIAYLHPPIRETGVPYSGRYGVSIDGEKIIENSRDPECDLARALVARGSSGVVRLLDASTGTHRTTINIEKAAKLRTYDDSRGLGWEKWRPYQPLDVQPSTAETPEAGVVIPPTLPRLWQHDPAPAVSW